MGFLAFSVRAIELGGKKDKAKINISRDLTLDSTTQAPLTLHDCVSLFDHIKMDQKIGKEHQRCCINKNNKWETRNG